MLADGFAAPYSSIPGPRGPLSLRRLSNNSVSPLYPLSPGLTGVGGRVGAVHLPSRLELSVSDEKSVIINGPFVGLLETTLERSVLGRDVLGHFAVIVDRPGNTICLLHGRHRYVIQET